MAKKSDLEAAFREHVAACERSAARGADRDFPAALALATAAVPTLRPSVEYQRKYLDRPRPAIPAADTILRLAPPLFARPALDALDAEVRTWKKADRDACPDLLVQIAAAHELVIEAVRLWSSLAGDPPPPSPPGPPAGLLAAWTEMNLIARVPHAGKTADRPVTDLGRAARGKCTGCGFGVEVPTRTLLAPFPCPACRREQMFVITRRLI